jgi:hypothetical protein
MVENLVHFMTNFKRALPHQKRPPSEKNIRKLIRVVQTGRILAVRKENAMIRRLDCNNAIFARIAALLLSLALLAERAASRPLAARLRVCHVLMHAHDYAALVLLDCPEDEAASQPVRQAPGADGPGNPETPAAPGTDTDTDTGDETGTLLCLALAFRAIAALLIHACLTEGLARSRNARHRVTRSPTCFARPPQRRFWNGFGLVHDTS